MIQITLYQDIPGRELGKDRIYVGNVETFLNVVTNLSKRMHQDVDRNGQWYRVTAVYATGGDGQMYPVWGLRTGYSENIAWDASFVRGYTDAVRGNTLMTQKYGDAVMRVVYNPVGLEFSDTDSVEGSAALSLSSPVAIISCAVCGKESSHRCSVCKVTTYCDKDCQRMDWNTGGHSASCASKDTL